MHKARVTKGEANVEHFSWADGLYCRRLQKPAVACRRLQIAECFVVTVKGKMLNVLLGVTRCYF